MLISTLRLPRRQYPRSRNMDEYGLLIQQPMDHGQNLNQTAGPNKTALGLSLLLETWPVSKRERRDTQILNRRYCPCSIRLRIWVYSVTFSPCVAEPGLSGRAASIWSSQPSGVQRDQTDDWRPIQQF